MSFCHMQVSVYHLEVGICHLEMSVYHIDMSICHLVETILTTLSQMWAIIVKRRKFIIQKWAFITLAFWKANC